MADNEHLIVLKQGVKAWNRWRKEAAEVIPDLSGANFFRFDLRFADLSAANLSYTNLSYADLSNANLYGANLEYANLRGTNFNWTNLGWSILCSTDLAEARLISTDLNTADLSYANLSNASLNAANLTDAILVEVNFSNAKAEFTKFGGNDLSTARGLETVSHAASSMIGVDTLFASNGNIPAVFLRGAGVPEVLITYLPSLLSTGIEFYSLFISYSTADEAFAQRLHDDLQSKGIRCWFAPHHMESGKKIDEQVRRAIHLQDRTLVILSESSIQKPWVQYEMKNARKRELAENRPVLLPISICSFEKLQNWRLFHLNADLAEEIREYYIPDFSEWRNAAKYSIQLQKLVMSLRKDIESSLP
jgi:TIR domain/Pentapeptide repeats (8 copies)